MTKNESAAVPTAQSTVTNIQVRHRPLEDRRTIGVGTSVVQRVLGVNSHDRSLRVGAGRSGTPAAQHGLMVFKIKLSEERRTMANARSGDASGVDHHHDPAHRLLRQQDPLVRLKPKKLPPTRQDR